MSKPDVSVETLQAMADLLGLNVNRDQLEDLLPQVKGGAQAMAALDGLGLSEVEPAIVFRPERE